MATSTMKSHSNPLHNFSLPFLKWGGKNQTNSSHRHRRHTSGDDHNNSDPESESETRRSRSARNRFGSSSNQSLDKSMKQRQRLEPLETVSNKETVEEAAERKRDNTEEAVEEAEAEDLAQKPWKLRPRKPVFSKGTVEIGVGPSRNAESSEAVMDDNNLKTKSRRLRGTTTEVQNMEIGKKRKFWIALSKEEIEEDVFVMTGSRPARRPKRRHKNVQKQLDSVFPGLWLVGLSADAYKSLNNPSKASLRCWGAE